MRIVVCVLNMTGRPSKHTHTYRCVCQLDAFFVRGVGGVGVALIRIVCGLNKIGHLSKHTHAYCCFFIVIVINIVVVVVVFLIVMSIVHHQCNYHHHHHNRHCHGRRRFWNFLFLILISLSL